MKDFDEIENSVIDEFYNEAQEKVDENLKYTGEYTEFKSKLKDAVNKMDVLNEDIFDFDIDTLSIIEQGECIRENRRAKKEFLMFILLSFTILSLYALAVIKINVNILIISQIIIITIIPWIIIPVIAIKRRGSEG